MVEKTDVNLGYLIFGRTAWLKLALEAGLDVSSATYDDALTCYFDECKSLLRLSSLFIYALIVISSTKDEEEGFAPSCGYPCWYINQLRCLHPAFS